MYAEQLPHAESLQFDSVVPSGWLSGAFHATVNHKACASLVLASSFRLNRPLVSGNVKSFSIKKDAHLDTVLRDVERNDVQPRVVKRAEDWTWKSQWRWLHPTKHLEKPTLCP